MVSSVLLSWALLAHGADPRPITADEAGANLIKFFVTIVLALVMVVPVLLPLFKSEGTEAEADSSELAAEKNFSLIGWVGVGLMLVLSMAWWLTRTSLVELNTKEAPIEDHTHTQEQGGQIAMWSDFHAEVSRIESGEVRIHLTDSFNRPIAARFFEAEFAPMVSDDDASTSEDDADSPTAGDATASTSEDDADSLTPADATDIVDPSRAIPGTKAPRGALASPTGGADAKSPLGPGAKMALPSLNDSYRFAHLDRKVTAYRVRVTTPGWFVTLKFEFTEGKGKHSLPIWCSVIR